MKKSVKVFISYSRKDTAFVENLVKGIQYAGGIDVTIDAKSIAFGDSLQDFVEQAVRDTDLTISVVSKHSLESAWVAQEFLETLMYEKVNAKKKLLPIYIDQSLFDNAYYPVLLNRINENIQELTRMTGEAVSLGGNTPNYDLQRERLHTLKSQLGTILQHLQNRLAANFSNEQVMAENLPQLLNSIKEYSENTQENGVKPTEPEPAPFIPFVNRKAEWEKVVLYPEGQYYIFDGPAGYGKTALLQKIYEEFERRKWFCVRISLQAQSTLLETIEIIRSSLDRKSQIFPNDPHRTGIELGKSLAQKHEQDKFEGLVLIIDIEHEPKETVMSILKTLVAEIVPGIYDGLTHNSPFFKETFSVYRIILSGRYLASRVHELDYKYNITRLKPFDYNVALDICKQYVKNSHNQSEFAAHLLFYSGGHPRCMVKILEMYKNIGYPPPEFFRYYREDIEKIALDEANWIHTKISPPLTHIFDTLCIYRKINASLIKSLLSQFVWDGDEYDLILNLRSSYLLDWSDNTRRTLSDDITRRLLALRLRYSIDATSLQKKCEEAKSKYLSELEKSVEYRAYWANEALFEYLQGHVHAITEKTSRQKLRRQFLEEELPTILTKLGQDQDSRLHQESLIGVLSNDWEFRFTLNYYLRDDTFNDNPYQEMIAYIQKFFTDYNQKRGGK